MLKWSRGWTLVRVGRVHSLFDDVDPDWNCLIFLASHRKQAKSRLHAEPDPFRKDAEDAQVCSDKCSHGT